MQARPPLLHRLGLVVLWWLAAAALVLATAAAGAALALAGFALAGFELGEVQRALWIGLARAIATTALAPLGAWTLGTWWLAATVRPTLDARWRSLAPGVALLAALGFPPVGAFCFTAWHARSALDYAATWLLVAGSVAGALLLVRRMLPALAPGAFGGRAVSG